MLIKNVNPKHNEEGNKAYFINKIMFINKKRNITLKKIQTLIFGPTSKDPPHKGRKHNIFKKISNTTPSPSLNPFNLWQFTGLKSLQYKKKSIL